MNSINNCLKTNSITIGKIKRKKVNENKKKQKEN